MIEIADIFRDAGRSYREAFADRMLPSHLRVMRDILDCRTAALGGHLRQCDHCNQKLYSYHSCRNRHCPKCHGDQTRRWLDGQRSRLLPCPYFLLTFTLPAQFRPFARSNQKLMYDILMRSAAAALAKLAADPRRLGARLGLLAVLHTWTRSMAYHPHVHILATAGGLSPDGQRWIEPKNRFFLVSGRVLSVIFRAKVRDAIEKAGFSGSIPRQVWRKKWVVHCQHAGTGKKVLDYLGRYVFRIALVNSRLERFEEGQVTFGYRDGRSGKARHCTLSAQDFIARFLQHVLPRGFTKVRHYGLYSPTLRAKLEKARQLLNSVSRPETEPSANGKECPGDSGKVADPDLCTFCGIGHMHWIEKLPRARRPP